MIKKQVILCILILLISSFALGNEPPKCSDNKTISLVKRILLDNIGFSDKSITEQINNQLESELIIKLPRATDYNEKIYKYKCIANLTIGDIVDGPIAYESQIDDNGYHVVSVEGMSRRDKETLMISLIEVLKRKGKDLSRKNDSSINENKNLQDQYAGRHPSEIFKEPLTINKFKSLLGSYYEAFVASVDVASEIEIKGEYYFGSGCAPHSCSIEEAAFVIHKPTGKVFAAQLIEGNEVKLFGASSANEFPEPLREWCKEHGVQSTSDSPSVNDQTKTSGSNVNKANSVQNPKRGPSFNCNQAATFIEKSICANNSLSLLDFVLSEDYKYMISLNVKEDVRNELKLGQKKWLTERNKCVDNQCLEKIYRKRIDEVCDYPVLSGSHPDQNCIRSGEVSAN